MDGTYNESYPEPLIIKNPEDLDIKEETFTLAVECITGQDNFLSINSQDGLNAEITKVRCSEKVKANKFSEPRPREGPPVLQRLRPRLNGTATYDKLPNNSENGKQLVRSRGKGRKAKVSTRQAISIESNITPDEVKNRCDSSLKPTLSKQKTEPDLKRKKVFGPEKLKQNTCRCCGVYFRKLSKLKAHQNRPGSFGCSLCTERFEFKCGLWKHLDDVHDSEKMRFVCSDCGKKFDSHYKMTRHKLSHTEILPFGCTECVKRFRRKDQLGLHVRTYHSNEFNYTCQLCDQIFKNQRSLSHHMDKHATPLQCPHCPKILISKRRMGCHVITHGDKEFKCGKCPKAFYCQSYLDAHVVAHLRSRHFKCDFCEKKFKSKIYLRKHHWRSSCGKKLPYLCSFCTTYFATEDGRKEHEKTHIAKRKLKCSECKKFFQTKENLSAHMDFVHKIKPDLKEMTAVVKCEPKNGEIFSKMKLRESVVVLHRLYLGKSEKKPKWFKYLNGYCYLKKCTVKNIFYWRCSELITEKCGAALKENMVTGDIRKGQNDHTHPPNPKMQLAVKLEPGTSGFDISSDVKPTLVQSNVEGFFQNVQKKRKIYNCSYCKKIFGKKSTLQAHVRLHTGEKPYACPFCDKTFRASGTLISHKRQHTHEKPYKCSDCNYSAATGGLLRSHRLRNHTKNRPKPYKCNFCPKAFALKGGLALHQRSHTKEKPYECSVCKNRYGQCGALNRHKKTQPLRE